jgi:hypothetical protein
MLIKNLCTSQVSVAHACNPSYSGGSNQEDWGSKPAQANSLRNPNVKIPDTKRTGGVAQDVGPEFKPQYRKKKKTVHKLGAVVLAYLGGWDQEDRGSRLAQEQSSQDPSPK